MNTLAVRYIIYKCIKEYQSLKNETLVTFNKENNFSLEKCLLLPYIITIANGQKVKLLKGDFNNSFYPRLIDKKGVVVYNNHELNNITIHNEISLNLLFNKNILQDNFNENEFENLDSNTKQHIDKSFSFLLTERDPDFPLHSVQTLETLCMTNFAFENMEALYKDKVSNGSMTELEVIIKFQFFTERSRFFYSSNPEFGKTFEWYVETEIETV